MIIKIILDITVFLIPTILASMLYFFIARNIASFSLPVLHVTPSCTWIVLLKTVLNVSAIFLSTVKVSSKCNF